MKRDVTFSYFYNAFLEYYPLHQAWRVTKFIKYREKNAVTRYVQNVQHWHEHKHASLLAIGQLRHQSATAPSLVAILLLFPQSRQRQNNAPHNKHYHVANIDI